MSSLRSTVRQELRDLITGGAIPPFVYCYPTRSAYRAPNPDWTIEKIWEEDERNSPNNDLNIYIHVPFCRYKCGFCNLYTVISEEQSVYDAYTDALCKQLEESRGIIEKRNLRTVYIGGGTPSLLARHNFDAIFKKIEDIYPNWRSIVDEVAIEATPDSVVNSEEPNVVGYLMSLGLTRMNVGIQSLKKQELKEAGRSRANAQVIREAIRIIKDHKLPNLSTDLVMGFAGQTDETWAESVRELVALEPDTISTYFLTIRPDAWFSKIGRYIYQRDPQFYHRYDFARDTILEAGYVQESNVRYKMQGRGGYRQKVLQFCGVPILGIGAGARSYTNTIDYIIGGSHKPDVRQVWDYIKAVRNGENLILAGFDYTDEERIRKRLVLHLFDLDLKELERYNVEKYAYMFEDILEASIAEGLLRRVGASRYQLTSSGYKYRDIISWMLFSERVINNDKEFYLNLHKDNLQAQVKMGEVAFVSGLR